MKLKIEKESVMHCLCDMIDVLTFNGYTVTISNNQDDLFFDIQIEEVQDF